MFPVVLNAKDQNFGSDHNHALGAMADSFYEYLPKVSEIGLPHVLGPLGV